MHLLELKNRVIDEYFGRWTRPDRVCEDCEEKCEDCRECPYRHDCEAVYQAVEDDLRIVEDLVETIDGAYARGAFDCKIDAMNEVMDVFKKYAFAIGAAV